MSESAVVGTIFMIAMGAIFTVFGVMALFGLYLRHRRGKILDSLAYEPWEEVFRTLEELRVIKRTFQLRDCAQDAGLWPTARIFGSWLHNELKKSTGIDSLWLSSDKEEEFRLIAEEQCEAGWAQEIVFLCKNRKRRLSRFVREASSRHPKLAKPLAAAIRQASLKEDQRRRERERDQRLEKAKKAWGMKNSPEETL